LCCAVRFSAISIEQKGVLLVANSVQGYQSIHNLERTFRRLCDRLGIPRISPNKLRHYFATYALRGGAKLEVVSKILGHSSVAITADVYRTVKQDEIREEHGRFGPLGGSQRFDKIQTR